MPGKVDMARSSCIMICIQNHLPWQCAHWRFISLYIFVIVLEYFLEYPDVFKDKLCAALFRTSGLDALISSVFFRGLPSMFPKCRWISRCAKVTWEKEHVLKSRASVWRALKNGFSQILILKGLLLLSARSVHGGLWNLGFRGIFLRLEFRNFVDLHGIREVLWSSVSLGNGRGAVGKCTGPKWSKMVQTTILDQMTLFRPGF